MKRLYIQFNLVLILFLMSCNQQIEHEELKKNIFEIKSINPTNTDYTDLLPLQKAIGDSRIVLLGEQEHGDGSTYLAKSRLVKFLHEEMDFDVLAFESDFFGVNKSWDDYKTGKKNYQDVLNQMYIFWPQSQMCQDLFQTIEESQGSSDPIFLAGFDNRQLSNVSREELIPALDSIIRANNISLAISDLDYFKNTLNETMEKLHDQELTKENQEKFISILHLLIEEFQKKEVDSFWIQELQNTKGFVMHAWYWWIDRKKDLVNNNYRDQQMASNCLWLLNEKYKGKKIIVWAANGHVIKTDTLFDVEAGGWKPDIRQYPMGEVLFNNLGDDIYAIGFTSYKGQTTSLEYDSQSQDYLFQSYEFEPADSGSFEFEINQFGFDYGFINLRNLKSLTTKDKRIRIGRPVYVRGKLPNIYDGVFYIHDMKPNKKVHN